MTEKAISEIGIENNKVRFLGHSGEFASLLSKPRIGEMLMLMEVLDQEPPGLCVQDKHGNRHLVYLRDVEIQNSEDSEEE